jgi:hypothetical protein
MIRPTPAKITGLSNEPRTGISLFVAGNSMPMAERRGASKMSRVAASKPKINAGRRSRSALPPRTFRDPKTSWPPLAVQESRVAPTEPCRRAKP